MDPSARLGNWCRDATYRFVFDAGCRGPRTLVPMTSSETGFPRGRIGWIVGTVVLIGGGALLGAILGNLVVGLLLGVLFSLGWLIAYESWRGNNNKGVNDTSSGIEL